MKQTYDYETVWKDYAYEKEELRFLVSGNDLLKVCECIDLKKNSQDEITGCVPVHYDRENQRLYVLAGDNHCRVYAQTGSKKSRSITNGSVIATMLGGDSATVIDPKGEVSSDPKIQKMIHDFGYDAYVLDFRSFDKDGFNIFENIIRFLKKDSEEKAMEEITRMVSILNETGRERDPFWVTSARRYIEKAQQFVAKVLVQKEEMEKYFHIETLNQYVGIDKDKLGEFCDDVVFWTDEQELISPFREYQDFFQITSKTYSGIAATAVNLLGEFGRNESLKKMLSISTFDPCAFYEKPSLLFLVIPDETKAYDKVAGYVMDMISQIQTAYYAENYTGDKKAPCWIHQICDEFTSIRINDMRSKIAAGRSRQMNWVLIYQDEHQLQAAYPNDYGAILGNCKHQLFLGSCKYETLKCVSEETGMSRISPRGQERTLVTVEELRGMRKEKDYKEALLISGKYLYCAKLPDYASYEFLTGSEQIQWKNRLKEKTLYVYTQEEFMKDLKSGVIEIFSKNGKNEDILHNMGENQSEELSGNFREAKIPREKAQEVLDRKVEELFGKSLKPIGFDSW